MGKADIMQQMGVQIAQRLAAAVPYQGCAEVRPKVTQRVVAGRTSAMRMAGSLSGYVMVFGLAI